MLPRRLSQRRHRMSTDGALALAPASGSAPPPSLGTIGWVRQRWHVQLRRVSSVSVAVGCGVQNTWKLSAQWMQLSSSASTAPPPPP